MGFVCGLRMERGLSSFVMCSKERAMMNESSRIFVAGGVLIGALMLASLGLRFGNQESAAKDADGRIDTSLASAARPVTADTPVDDPQNAGIARVLQAVHDSLQSGDLASAHLLLDAVLTMRKDEPQALLLQKELAAREESAHGAREASVVASTVQTTSKPHARLHVTAKAKSHRATDTSGDDDIAAAAPPVDIRSGSSNDVAAESAHAIDSSTSLQLTKQPEPVPAPPVLTAAAPAAPTDQPVAPAAKPTQVQQNDGAPATARSNAPKTRAEVRDELSRARGNGTMSRFGNPDPYGPGGSPSYSAHPSIRTW
jgi:hypothetical protein